MLYLIHATDAPNMADKVAATLESHQHSLHDAGKALVLAGGMRTEEGKGRLGSVYLLNGPNRAAAEAWLANEPFNKAGVFSSVIITKMRRGHWHPENAPKTVEGD